MTLVFALGAHAAPPNPKVLERYEQMLSANPVEGMALDRLWAAAAERGESAALLERFAGRDTFAAQMVYGHLLKRMGRVDDALAAYERAAALTPSSGLPALALGELHLQNGRPRAAAEWLEKAAAAFPEGDARRVDASLRIGSAWIAAGEVEAAVDSWEKAVAAAAGNLDLRWRLVETYTRHQLGGRALVHLEYLAAQASPAERTRAYEQLARLHEGAGRADEAIAALEKGIALTGAGNWMRTNLQSQLIRIHQRHRRIDQLEQKWRQDAATNPRDAGAWQRLLELFDRTGDLVAQKATLETLISLAPRSFEHRLRHARLLARMDDVDGAIARFDQLLREQPANPDLVFERARLDVLRDATPNAHARIEGLLRARPQEEALQARAVEFFEAHHMTDALEERLIATARGGADESFLALARFYFGERRDNDARAALQRIIPRGGTPAEQAAAHYRIAQALRSQGDLAGAVEALRNGARLAPEQREIQLLLGELESARGNAAAARAALEQAFRASRTEAEALEADQKLFDAMRSETVAEASSSEPRHPATFRTDATGGRAAPGASISTPALQDQLLALTRTAAAEGSVSAWLRAARWQLWTRSPRVAQECAQQALTIDPRSIAAHEFMAKLAAADPQPQRAIQHLRELIAIDPTHATSYRRRIAQIEAQGNRYDEALRIFRELAAADPGNLDALNDVALAEQRAERWSEALVTSREIFARSPAARKKEAAAQLLRVYDRLHMSAEAAELLLAQIDAASDEKDRTTLFHDLLAHCTRTQRLPWLRMQFETRQKTRIDDYFTGLALGRVLKALGEKEAAFDLLASVCFAAPDPAESLPELVQEAEELRKFDAAARLQEQLIKIVPTPGIDAYTKLAQLQERNFQIEAAARTWEKVTVLFPRQTDALLRAVEFELQWGHNDRARRLLRKVCALEPANVRALNNLVQLELEAGASAEAEQHLEEILRFAPPESGGSVRFPAWRPEDAGRLQTTYLETVRLRRGRPNSEAMRALRSFWVDDQPRLKNEEDVRLNAIRDLARLAQNRNDKAALGRWVERWRKSDGSPSERLAAFYHAGAWEPLFDELEKLMAQPELEAQAKQAFLWLGLQTQQIPRLSRWLRAPARTAADRDFLLVALGQYLQSQNAAIAPEAIEQLFPRSFRLRLWQAAQMFASRGRFREAARLGQRVFDSLATQRATYGIDLATWRLYLGEISAARETLRASIERPGESFDTPVYAALRQYWTLLPTTERASFTETFLTGIRREASPLHAAICGAALHGLTGDRTAAERDLRELLNLGAMSNLSVEASGNSASRAWDFILQAGAQLESWRLDDLASFVWEAALQDPALVRLQSQTQGEQVQTRAMEVRTRLTALKISRADSGERATLVADYRRHLPQDDLMPLAEALETRGAFACGIEISEEIWTRDTSNPHALRNLIGACRTGGDSETLERVLRRCVDEGIYRPNDAAHRDLAMQLADVLEARGAVVEARDVLVAVSNGNDSKLLYRLGKLQEATGQPAAAERSYQRVLTFEPANGAAIIALASLAEGQGDLARATALLEKATNADVEGKLAELHVKAGRRADALSLVERAVPGNHMGVTLAAANALVAHGENREATIVLRNGIHRGKEWRANYPMQARLIELLPPGTERGTVLREWRCLRQMARDDRHLLAEYYDLLLAQAARLDCAREGFRELTEAADEGRGLLPAAVALADWHAQQGEMRVAEAIAARVLQRADLTEQAAERCARLATKHERPALLIEARARLARINPLDHARMLAWADALHAQQRDVEARAVLDELRWRAGLNEEVAGRIAETFAQWNDNENARRAFTDLAARDATARDFRAHMSFARFLAAEGNREAAWKMMRKAFGNPANREVSELVSFLATEGRLDEFESVLQSFALDRPRVMLARRALLRHWQQAADLPAALRCIESHPELADSAALEPVRLLATSTKQFSPFVQSLERLRMQRSTASPAIARTLGRTLGDWAEAELEDFQTTSALTHLQRGAELVPEHFPIARRLSELHLEQGNATAAADTLEKFLAASEVPAERENARQRLVRLRAAR